MAEAGDGRAQMRLGLMYTFGHGLAANAEEGRFWLREAALQGESEAQINLGVLHAQGIGTSRTRSRPTPG